MKTLLRLLVISLAASCAGAAADTPTPPAFMPSDPAIMAGVMRATLHPCAVALQRKN